MDVRKPIYLRKMLTLISNQPDNVTTVNGN